MPHDERHFDDLLEWLALERAEEVARVAELKATLPLGELERLGLVWLDLESTGESVGLGGRFLVTLERADKKPFPAPLSNGDLVEVRPRRAEAEPELATVSQGRAARVELAFDRAPPDFVAEGRLRVDRIANEVTYERARTAVGRFREPTGPLVRRRDVLLGRERPRFDDPPKLEPSRFLNPEQREAVGLSLAAKDFFLVHGPPGTGKSTVLAEVAVQAARRGERLLCTAASNAAVDHLLELCLDQGLRAIRVGHPARVLDRLKEHTLDLLVERHPDRVLAKELFADAFELLGYARRQRRSGRSRERFSNAREASAEARKLMDEARALERRALASVLGSAEVVCATLSMLESNALAGQTFDRVLLDEATQAIEPLALSAFAQAPVVLAGDHRQLPPTVLSMEAAKRGLSTSLFERLLETHGDSVRRMLREQYRMHERIMSFPSREMYGNELRAHPSVASRLLFELLTAEVDAPPVLFLDTAGKGFDEQRGELSESFCNEGEARLVVAHARRLLEAGLPARELAVIAPYRAQARLIEDLLAAPGVEVDTVDAFQGREKEAVLVSMTRSNGDGALGFLTDLRRMNVAMTRPKRHLFVVGDSATLSSHPFYARFIDEAQKSGGYRSAWEWPEPGM